MQLGKWTGEQTDSAFLLWVQDSRIGSGLLALLPEALLFWGDHVGVVFKWL